MHRRVEVDRLALLERRLNRQRKFSAAGFLMCLSFFLSGWSSQRASERSSESEA